MFSQSDIYDQATTSDHLEGSVEVNINKVREQMTDKEKVFHLK